MDLTPTGAHCALSSCNTFDFLPIRCQCTKLFCRFHISPELHDCSAQDLVNRQPELRPSVQSKCTLQSCGNASLESILKPKEDGDARPSVLCSNCMQPFCIAHRHPKDHSCSGPKKPEAPRKNEAARLLLSKNFPSKSAPLAARSVQRGPIKVSASTNPKTASQIEKVEQMKLRHGAIAGDPEDSASTVPMNQRLYLKAKSRLSNSVEQEIKIWFRQSIVTGKVIDLLIKHFDVTDSEEYSFALAKVQSSGGLMPLHNEQHLADQIADGSTLFLTSTEFLETTQ
ncbi:hypothetical protein SERLADRAFT_357479 [Serpula lacrymans var. lacrymans S7.9]|uniref:AN1-type domain-containing protein n=1 Tax=Serpula lacrymans var. lacrymans (strain S7.9) TaxID=578457 RepID=F8P4U5_SERL9|nr:uncharacterized protein SERLADRAFT_357479 [Serpula lacrymans var. lacrymans S7.9]EGO21632.1 hypothetical protein SERLADRAFT_357479 [Serpula lacrymans var. lacrymans S7.9]